VIKNLEVNFENNAKINKSVINKIVVELRKDLHFEISSLIINFVSAAKITELNKIHLNHNYSTDIITFNYSDDKSVIDTEIFISTDDARENADKFYVSFDEEIIRLVIHGILHVTGYDDKTPSEKKKMKRMENKLLNNYKFVLLKKKNKI